MRRTASRVALDSPRPGLASSARISDSASDNENVSIFFGNDPNLKTALCSAEHHRDQPNSDREKIYPIEKDGALNKTIDGVLLSESESPLPRTETALLVVGHSSLSMSSSPPPNGDDSMDRFLEHPALQGFWRSERRAIYRHSIELSISSSGEFRIEEVLESWESGPCVRWRKSKMKLDGRMQLKEIERHKYLISQERGHDIGWDHATANWILLYAAIWRSWWEFQPQSDPFQAD